MSKSFCRLGFANGSVDDGAVSGRAIDGGELIIDFVDTELIPFDGTNKCAGSVDADNELINRWLRVTGAIVIFGCCVVAADAVDDDDANVGCIRSVSGFVMASNKNDNRKSTKCSSNSKRKIIIIKKSSHAHTSNHRLLNVPTTNA